MTTAQLPRGANLSLFFKTQSGGFKTAATGNYLTGLAYSIGLKKTQPPVEDPLLGQTLNNTRDETEKAPGLAQVGGPIVVPVDTSHLGYWLFLAMGAPTTTGADTDFVHAFNSGKVALPEYTIERKLVGSGGSLLRQFTGVMCNKFSIQASRKDGYARLSLDCVGYDEVPLEASGAGVPVAAVAREPLTEALGVYKMDGVAAALMECNLTFANNLVARDEMGDDRMGGYDIGDFKLESGSIRLRYRDDTLDAAALAGTEHAGELLYQKSSTRLLSLAMGAVKLERQGEEVNNRGVIEQTFNLHARQTNGAPLLVATLKGGVSAYA